MLEGNESAAGTYIEGSLQVVPVMASGFTLVFARLSNGTGEARTVEKVASTIKGEKRIFDQRKWGL